MSIATVLSPFAPDREDLWYRDRPTLAKQIWNTSQFLRSLRVQMRFGELTRAPLQLLRFQMLADVVECDWLARLPDPWDADLSHSTRQRHKSLQTIRDAIDVRALLFDTLPQIETAHFRVFRYSESYTREMIITGCAQRNDNAARNLHSLVMRARLLGFRFNLDGDLLSGI